MYTLEYTYGRTITLLSKLVTKDLYSFYANRSRYEGCPNTLVLSFAPSGIARTIHVHSEGDGAGYVFDSDSNSYFNSGITYQLPAHDSIFAIRYQIDPKVENGSQMYFTYQVSGSISETTEIFNLYARPVITLQKYIPPAPKFKGLLEIAVVNGSPYIQRSLNEGESWEAARDTLTNKLLPFTQSQIANLSDHAIILFREPNSCVTYDTLRFADPLNPVIMRSVIIPEISDAVYNILPGEHFILSGSDFSFTVTPTTGNTGKELHFSTSRTLIPDSEGVSIVKHDNGSYTVTILRIQESTSVYIDFVMNNYQVGADKVWSHKGCLYIQTEKDGEARIYSLSGSFVQAVDFCAGETVNIPLVKGFYAVTIHEKMYKVVVQ